LPAKQHDALCELNVIEQVRHVAQTTAVQGAWERGQSLTVHGWVYGIDDGFLRDLKTNVDEAAVLDDVLNSALAALR
jgi:carbonic anhydrase